MLGAALASVPASAGAAPLARDAQAAAEAPDEATRTPDEAPDDATRTPDEAPDDAATRTPDEARLEGRLLAPCCWRQTLDAHDSPLARGLRREIRARLRAGELPEAIEGELAGRFGERVRAVPKGRDPRDGVALFAGAAALLALAGVARTLGRWRRAGRLAGVARAAFRPPDDGAYDARLDEELRALGD